MVVSGSADADYRNIEEIIIQVTKTQKLKTQNQNDVISFKTLHDSCKKLSETWSCFHCEMKHSITTIRNNSNQH